MAFRKTKVHIKGKIIHVARYKNGYINYAK